ncbi:MAG: GNAT family N-acetyltransferase [Acidobacteriota bacterium]
MKSRPGPEVPPPPYPAHEASDIVIRSGSTVRLRPIRPDDAAPLAEFYRRLSPESLYLRFFGAVRMDETRAAEICRVDYEDTFGFVAEVSGRIIAAAHYYRYPRHPERAEAAFAVEDALQGQGLGTRLLERLADVARAKNIREFDAEVLGQNRKMLGVFASCGFEVSREELGDGVVKTCISIASTPAYRESAAARSEHAAAASMARLFEPETVAVIGASRERGKIGAEILHNLVSCGFAGKVFPIHPGGGEVQGLPAFARVTDVPGPVDLAVIAVPAERVAGVVDDCIAKGVEGIVVISAGFAETGPEGREREAQLVEKIRGAGIRMVGPNCMGIVNTNPKVRLNATFGPVYPPEGRVALSSQSGALGLALLDYASRLNLGISTFVSVGNKADVSGNDLIQYWAEDPRTDVILLYLESFGNPARFSRIARRVARRKPIVAVKSGRSRGGARAASSHTGALAETDSVVDALFRQAGVIRTNTLEELFDVAALLANQPLPRGRRVAILTNAGGPGILAADVCEAQGLTLAPLSPATVRGLRAFLPAAASVGNPVDMLASADATAYRNALALLLKDRNVDAVLVIFIPPIATNVEGVASAIREAAGTSDKTVLSTFMSAKGAPAVLAPIPSYPFPESAALALARAASYGRWRNTPEEVVAPLPGIDSAAARAVIDSALSRGGGWLDPLETQSVLEAFGIPVAETRMVSEEEAAVASAEALGYPLVMKAVGPEILHKTEVGGVKLGLADAEAVRCAYRELSTRLGSSMTGVILQPMVPGGVEVLVGVSQDPTFGPLIAYGSGGTLVELLSDIAFRLQPVTGRDVSAMLDEVRGTALLRGFRGAPPADEGALKDLILRVSALVDACPEIRDMDLNPVKVLAKGVRVLDARVRVQPRPVPAVSRRIAY